LKAHARALATAIGVSIFATATVQSPDANAGTSTPSGLAASAASLQSRVLNTAGQLHLLATEAAAASARLSATEGAVLADQAALARLQDGLGRARLVLRTVALNDYESEGDSGDLFPFSATPAEASTTRVYEQVVAGSESDAVDRFLRDESEVAQQEALVSAERAAAANTSSTLNHEYSSLKNEASSEEAMLAQVQQQQAALAAQAQRAALAAQVHHVQRQGPPATVDVSALTGTPNSSLAEDLARLRQCESGDNYQDNTGNGYYGAYQFSPATWQNLGYSGLPSGAPPATQDQAATTLEQSDGWGQWPVCAALLGLD